MRNILIWCFLTGTALGMEQETKASTNAPALFVNQQPVSAEEFVWFMQQEGAGRVSVRQGEVQPRLWPTDF